TQVTRKIDAGYPSRIARQMADTTSTIITPRVDAMLQIWFFANSKSKCTDNGSPVFACRMFQAYGAVTTAATRIIPPISTIILVRSANDEQRSIVTRTRRAAKEAAVTNRADSG